jgi:F-type H+-transporting ATPase subunit b
VELSWPTFLLEVINFLVLVWILKRFLYKPVLEAIARRKAAIDKNLADAQAREASAQALEQQFQQRLAEWESEKQTLRAGLVEEINAQRAQMMAALENALKQEREKARVLEERRLAELRSSAEQTAVGNGVRFTARLLARAAGPELEAKLISLALEDFQLLSDEQAGALRSLARQSGLQVRVNSAYPLSDAQRNAIAQKLNELIQQRIPVEFVEDSGLLAGLRISIGPWVLRANLEDELEFFTVKVSGK